jgi:hypothetical protein
MGDGGQLDKEACQKACQGLVDASNAIREHHARIERNNLTATAADYEFVVRLLGLDNKVAAAAMPCQPTVEHDGLSANEVKAIADVLGIVVDEPGHTINVEADVVDVTQSVIGAEDVRRVAATLDLTTGRIVLADDALGHPLLLWDDAGATIHCNDRVYEIPVIENSVPHELCRHEVIEHVQQHGYWALLDLRALLARQRRAAR